MKTITITIQAYTLNELSANPMEHAIDMLEREGINIPSAEMFEDDTQLKTEARQAMKSFMNEILGAEMWFESDEFGESDDISIGYIENNGECIPRGMVMRDQNLINMCPEFSELPGLIEAMKCIAEDVIRLAGIVDSLEVMDLMKSAMAVSEDQRDTLSELESLSTQTLKVIIEETAKAARFYEANVRGILFDVDGNVVRT